MPLVGCALVAGIWWFVGRSPASAASHRDVRAAVPRSGGGAGTPGADRQSPAEGHGVYLQHCAMCHGAAGIGTTNGPSLRNDGNAAVDFMVRTGRMPLSSPDAPMERHKPKLSDHEIVALLRYTGTFTHGPEVPTVDTVNADQAEGFKYFIESCAPCHQDVGSGGALAYGEAAPNLKQSDAVEVVEAMRTGPGQMPTFNADAIDDKQAADIAKYVEYLHEPKDRGGFNLGHFGPVPEGFIAFALGLGALLLVAGRIGERTGERRRTGGADSDEG